MRHITVITKTCELTLNTMSVNEFMLYEHIKVNNVECTILLLRIEWQEPEASICWWWLSFKMFSKLDLWLICVEKDFSKKTRFISSTLYLSLSLIQKKLTKDFKEKGKGSYLHLVIFWFLRPLNSLNYRFIFEDPGNKLWNHTDVDRLKTDLLTNYDRLTRPANHNVPTRCNISITLIHMELDETKGLLDSHIWVKMFWNDSKLIWDNASYGGIGEIRVDADEVDKSIYLLNDAWWIIMPRY